MINLSIRKKNELTKKKKKGFTLIELIIVIAIIAILAAIALPRFGEIRENANVKADIANAKNIQTAVGTAMANNDITSGTTDISSDSLAQYLDGKVLPKVKANGHTTEAFNVKIDSDGTVRVYVGDNTQVLPQGDSPYNN